VQSLQNAGERSQAAVKINNELGEWFNISIGTKQGDLVSPSQFIAYLERAMDGIQNSVLYCYRRILNVNLMMRVTNVEIRRRLNIQENIMQLIIKRKVALFGHICRMENSSPSFHVLSMIRRIITYKSKDILFLVY